MRRIVSYAIASVEYALGSFVVLAHFATIAAHGGHLALPTTALLEKKPRLPS
jgi:hypothetical protein